MTKKVWTASSMGKKGIQKMLEHFDPDPVEARKKIAKRKKKLGVNLGGRPTKYPPCTFRFASTNRLRGCHRFKDGVCDCGVRKNPKA
jgi:hypothetical protein